MPDRAHACVIALDVGGTGMKGALLDRRMRPLFTLRRPTHRAHGPDAVVGHMAAVLGSLAERAAAMGSTVLRAGVAVPGIVDENQARAVYSATIGWRDLPLGAVLEQRTGIPVTLGHDVRAGGNAERVLGAARGARDVLFVAIGTGVSAAVISDGRPVRGGGFVGELGHLVSDPDGAVCGCGVRGCVETVATAAAIATAFTVRSGRPVEGADEVAALVAQGDPHALSVWNRAVDTLATAFATVSTLLAPELIVVGGGLAEAGDLLLDPIRKRLADRLTFQRRPLLVRAELGDQAGCLGAGLLAWDAVTGVTGIPAGAEVSSP
ncbi:ROK family protein [Streptomyces luteolus]|uniref:ROK family protein n=1 Tax=Streptomyces luteolus TaxID=3043615 RepID=A0ABT6T214_9ACTN|nr:ROK family protein [Streptomyces sp. B-S-A12]MDI3421655.1 ROK family protein [Streptomyces sp. B-S-A12]